MPIMAADNNAAYTSLVELARESQTQLDLTNITFHKRLEEDETSVIYLISIHDKHYVMKAVSAMESAQLSHCLT